MPRIKRDGPGLRGQLTQAIAGILGAGPAWPCGGRASGTSISRRQAWRNASAVWQSRSSAPRGAPKCIRSDNGSGFISRSLAAFLSKEGASSRFIEPGSPRQNGFAESFVSTLRRDLLDVEEFYKLLDAQIKLALYLRCYNQERPQSPPRYRPPAKAMSESQETYYRNVFKNGGRALILGSARFHETNVRTYVRRGDESGVWTRL